MPLQVEPENASSAANPPPLQAEPVLRFLLKFIFCHC
nr:MAG TPA: Protein of unknown function (DUF1181) [Caudoviricetes sp.]